MNERSLDHLHDSIEQWLAMAGQKIIGRGREYYRNGQSLRDDRGFPDAVQTA